MIDISEVRALTRAAERSLLVAQPRGVKRILDRAAAEERRTHRYKNRTGLLEASTFAADAMFTVPEGFAYELGARTFYASFVNVRGLMRIDQLAARAAEEIDFFLDGEAIRLGRSRSGFSPGDIGF